MTRADIAVVIAYYRNQATLPDQLNSLAAQRTSRCFEVVIADNENSRELRDLVRTFSDSLTIRVVPAHEKLGQCYARNVGVQAASAPYVALCDADDIVSLNWVDAMFNTLDAADVLATGPLRLNAINPPYTWYTNVSQGLHADRPKDYDGGPVLVGIIPYLGYLSFAFGCNVGMRRQTFLDLGGMDERHVGGSEDVDFSWRAQESGLHIIENPDATIDYRLRQDIGEIFAQRRRYFRAQLRLWGISRDIGRPVRGMSLRWAIIATAKLPIEYLRLRRAAMPARYAFAFRSGGVVGNLQGQLIERIIKPRIVADAREKLRETRRGQRRRSDL